MGRIQHVSVGDEDREIMVRDEARNSVWAIIKRMLRSFDMIWYLKSSQ